jgi:hypothetical protein
MVPESGEVRWFGDGIGRALERATYHFAGRHFRRLSAASISRISISSTGRRAAGDVVARVGQWIECRRARGDTILLRSGQRLLVDWRREAPRCAPGSYTARSGLRCRRELRSAPLDLALQEILKCSAACAHGRLIPWSPCLVCAGPLRPC